MSWLCSTVHFSCSKQACRICSDLLLQKNVHIITRLNLDFGFFSRNQNSCSEHGESYSCTASGRAAGDDWDISPPFLSYSWWQQFTMTLYLIQRMPQTCASFFSKFCLRVLIEVGSWFISALPKWRCKQLEE